MVWSWPSQPLHSQASFSTLEATSPFSGHQSSRIYAVPEAEYSSRKRWRLQQHWSAQQTSRYASLEPGIVDCDDSAIIKNAVSGVTHHDLRTKNIMRAWVGRKRVSCHYLSHQARKDRDSLLAKNATIGEAPQKYAVDRLGLGLWCWCSLCLCLRSSVAGVRTVVWK